MSDRNFRFVNDLAYTEDKILIKNIFVYKISSKVTEDDCRQYFTRYGEIASFRFIVKPGFGRRRGSRHAFVNYKDAKTAAAVLRKSHHTICPGKMFSVKACDSWHQPQTSKNRTECENRDSGSVTIFDLNEDCILFMFKYMQLRDQVSFARSHIHFESVFKQYAKIHYKTINTDILDTMSLWNVRQFFMLAGEFLEKLTFTQWFQDKDRERIAGFVQANCPNLKKVKLHMPKIRVPNLHKMLTNKPMLTMLSLNCLSINDHCVHAMKKTPTLEHLSIVHCYNFTGRFLYLLPQLKTLRLAHCSNLQTFHFQKAISVMPNLTALDVTGVERLRKEIFDNLHTKNEKLEILHMSCINAPYDSVAKLPKLRCLGLHCDNLLLLRVAIFRLLVEHRGEALESLQIISRQCLNSEQCKYIAQLKGLKKLHVANNAGINEESLMAFSALENLVELKLNDAQNVTNKGLLELVRNCTNLKWVNIQNTPIDNEFARKLLPLLRKTKRPNGRLTFLVYGSKMNQQGDDFPTEYKTDEMKSAVQFIFTHEMSLKSYDNLYDAFENDYNDSREIPFFEAESFNIDSDEDYDFDDDDSDILDDDDEIGLDEVGFLLNIPIFQDFAMRHAFGFEFGLHSDSDNDDDEEYIW